MMHMKRIALYFTAQKAHFVPLPACHVPCLTKYEVTESNQTWYMYALSVLVLDITIHVPVLKRAV